MMSESDDQQQKQNSAIQQTGPEAEAEAEAENVKPFSIRHYVLASRHRNIFHSWPFHDKYLQMCLNHGITDVLPPFGHQAPLAESLKGGPNLMHSQNDDSKKPDDQFCKTEVQPQYYHDIEQQPQNITKNECDDLLSHDEEEERSYKEGNQHNIIKCISASVNNYVSESADHGFTLPIPTSSIHDHKSCKSMAPSKAMLKEKRRRGRRRCKKRSMVDILAVASHCTLEEICRINKFCYTQTGINEA